MRTLVVLGVVLGVVSGCSSMEGPRGPAGEQGPAGPQGPAGVDGTDGSDGSDGTNGANGANGTNGQPGRDGDAGLDGLSAWVTAPGVRVEVTGLSQVAGEAVAQVRVTDGEGTPLDVTGRLTSGAVRLDFLLAQPDSAMSSWQPITTSPAFPTMSSPGVLAATDVRQGRYTFTFRPSPAGLDAGVAQVVLAVARRTVSGVTTTASTRFSTSFRGIVTAQNCAQCHGGFSIHEEHFTDVEQCPVCHQPQLRQADGGVELEWMRLMHRVHAGAELPSVAAGGTLVFTARDGGVFDATDSKFPRTLKHCESCHDDQGIGLVWSSAPSKTACGSCHDLTAFMPPTPAGFTAHPGGMVSDDMCAICHVPTVIEGQHAHPGFDAGVPGLELTLLGVTNSGPGQTPAVEFRVTRGGVPLDIIATPLTSLRFQFVGPNSEFEMSVVNSTTRSALAQGGGASGVLTAMNAAAGEFRYSPSSSATIPLLAMGSFTASADATLLVAGTRVLARSPIRPFTVTDPSPRARRSVIDPAKCEACHLQVEAHGTRRGAESCVVCHDSTLDDGDRLPRFEGSNVLVARSLDFKVMIHRIHRGAELTAPYQLGAAPGPTVINPFGTQKDFSQLQMPRSVGECALCHLTPAGGARPNWALPMVTARPVQERVYGCSEDPSQDVDVFCQSWTTSSTRSTPAESAVCTSCHDARWVGAHTEVNTSLTGVESCATCHEVH